MNWTSLIVSYFSTRYEVYSLALTHNEHEINPKFFQKTNLALKIHPRANMNAPFRRLRSS
jgi:hypothetical protein